LAGGIDCGKDDESDEHFLVNCEDMKVMMDTIGDLLLGTKPKRSLRITESLLLAPTCDDNISKRDVICQGSII